MRGNIIRVAFGLFEPVWSYIMPDICLKPLNLVGNPDDMPLSENSTATFLFLCKCSEIRAVQGPALYVYNDAVFSDADWKGIRMLHESIKEDDPMKVGRFGLGFKSVFHMTG